MGNLSNKKIILGISGSISAYKSVFLVRLLKQEGAEVKVVMTEAAKDFISPLTLSTLSENTVLSSFTTIEGDWHSHVKLGIWADLILIAPASAHTLAKMVNGLCDNLLMAIYLSARCPIWVAPAMDLDMYGHITTKSNLKNLENHNVSIIDCEEGELASGLIGKGRLAEPEHIIKKVEDFFNPIKPLKGKKVLLTAGPTHEPIDPVRFITNASSGKMGYALANEFHKQGAEVRLISGPIALSFQLPKTIEISKVSSAEDMYKETLNYYSNTDIAVFAAAVADYTPCEVSNQKIKKKSDIMTIQFKKNIDIAKEMGIIKQKHQINIGFALETNDEKKNALKKLNAKNFDAIVLNSLKEKGAGFGYDTNIVTIIDKNKEQAFPLKSKMEVAKDIVQYVCNLKNWKKEI